MLTAIIVFVAIPFVLVGIARFTGASDWSGLFGDIFYWNYVSGPTFIMGFVMILGAVGIAVYLIFKAFDTGKGAW